MRILSLFLCFIAGALHAQSYTSYLTGTNVDADVQPEFGIVLMGGAGEDDNAMTWFLERANGGDVVVLRASGSDGYNDYLYSDLGVSVNSVESIVFHSAEAASDPYVIQRVQQAEAIWMAGGDQWNYVSYWQDNAVGQAINDLLNVRGGVVGGISAGMAVLGGTYFSAQNGTVTSAAALANPYANAVQLGHNDFLNAPFLHNVVTDTHYDDPDRRGRHIAFMARMATDLGIDALGIACDEYGAVCINAEGIARCFGEAPEFEDYVYFVRPACDVPSTPNVCEPNQPLLWNHNGQALKALRVAATADGSITFDLNDWTTHNGGIWLDWVVDNGTLIEAEGEAPNCTLVSVKEPMNAPAAMHVYPNPSTGQITLDGDHRGEVFVFGLNGRMVFQTTLTASNTTLDLGHLPAGVYVLKARQGQVRILLF